MATTFATLIASVRTKLDEGSAVYWTDAEILAHLQNGAKDLWRRINDLYENHFVTLDTTNMTIAADAYTVTGVPADVYRIVEIEPRTLGESSTTPGLIFKPKDYQRPEFREARARGSVSPTNQIVYYTLFNAGGPVAAPTIRIAPALSAAVNLTVLYVPTLDNTDMTSADDNPVPGESDNALVAWATAYCRARETDSRAPDPEWLAVYATEKANLIEQIGPRQIQEVETVDGLFENPDNSGDYM